MPDTHSLKLPLLSAEQAQKHVTHNEALRALDAMVQLAVKDRDLAAPPGSPADGDRYIVAASPTGVWSGHAADIAVFQDGAWDFHDPNEGWRCWVEDENVFLIFDGSAWVDWGAALGAIQSLSLLGVGTTADATNPFSAKLNKALWTAKTAAEGGDGDLRTTMNKETAADVLSLLMQRGFSGRAEIGLIGDDDFSIKVSPDGSAWQTALIIDKDDGGIDVRLAESNVASAGTCDIGAAPTTKVQITGTTTITSFGTAALKLRLIRFAGALTLTHNATTLILPGSANITTAAGDTAVAASDASGNWRVWSYTRASGKPVKANTPTEVIAGVSDYDNVLAQCGYKFSSGTLADDSVWSFQPSGGVMVGSKIDFVPNASGNGYGGFFVRAATTPSIVSMYGSGLTILAAGTVPTGTTGVDGNTSISSDTAGNVYVENRRGFAIGMSAYVYR